MPLDETGRPDVALGRLLDALAAWPALWLLACVVGAATLALPYAKERGLWGIAFWASGFLGLAILLPAGPGGAPVSAVGLAVGIWATAVWLATEPLRTRR
jgi:hypothetical protein